MPESVVPKGWRIVAQSASAHRFLLAVSGTPGKRGSMGRVLELNRGILFPEFNFDSLLARGYWHDYKGPQDVLPGLLAQVKRYDRTQDLPA